MDYCVLMESSKFENSQSKNPENKSLNMKTNVDCPGVTGYLTIPHLFSTIESVVNFV